MSSHKIIIIIIKKRHPCFGKITHCFPKNPQSQSKTETKEADTWKDINLCRVANKSLKQHSQEMLTKNLKNVCVKYTISLCIHVRQAWPFSSLSTNSNWASTLKRTASYQPLILNSAVSWGITRELWPLSTAESTSNGHVSVRAPICIRFVSVFVCVAYVFIFTKLLIYSLSLPLYCTWNDPCRNRISSRSEHEEVVTFV